MSLDPARSITFRQTRWDVVGRFGDIQCHGIAVEYDPAADEILIRPVHSRGGVSAQCAIPFPAAMLEPLVSILAVAADDRRRSNRGNG